MGDKSAIEWTEATWNPVTGCSKVSPGCAHCYAETLSLRFGWSAKPWTPENAKVNVLLRPERLDQPLRWKRPRMIFVNSMSDMFHELVPREYIDKVFAVMAMAPQHTYQVLTKRPERAYEYMTEGRPWARVGGRAFEINHYSGIASGLYRQEGWPLPNVWMGTSIENSRYTFRADVLRETPAAVHFISAEPLLGSLFGSDSQGHSSEPDVRARPLVLGGERATPSVESLPNRASLDLTGIEWLIAGGESGPNHRPMNPEWARELRDACAEAGIAFFFKQWGGRTAKAGGKELDGREWCELPLVEAA